MTSVWTVEHGEYSDYTVDHVFATKEAADAYVAGKGDTYYEYRVVERPLLDDPGEVVVERLTLEAFVHHDGQTEEREQVARWFACDDDRDSYTTACNADLDRYGPSMVRVWVAGTDHERVRKVYSEHRAQAIAMIPLLTAPRELTEEERRRCTTSDTVLTTTGPLPGSILFDRSEGDAGPALDGEDQDESDGVGAEPERDQ